jgi:hypothetical protein
MSNLQTEKLQEYADEMIANYTDSINTIIDYIISNIEITPSGTDIKLSMDDLYAIAIKLPAECSFLQNQINSQSIQQKISAFITETKLTETVTLLQGSKGNAKERQKRAEVMSKEAMLQDITAEHIVLSLQAVVNRADKVYEGVKKVIDAKSKEFNFDKKPGNPVAI